MWTYKLFHTILFSTRVHSINLYFKNWSFEHYCVDFFSCKVLLTLDFYSSLFYNSEIWHIPTLHQLLRSKLLSSSTKALRICMKTFDPFTSFECLQHINNRANPQKMLLTLLAWHSKCAVDSDILNILIINDEINNN